MTNDLIMSSNQTWNFPVEITNDDDYFENSKIDSWKLRGNWTILFFFTEFDENANEVLSKVMKQVCTSRRICEIRNGLSEFSAHK